MQRNRVVLVTSLVLILSFGISTFISIKSIRKVVEENNRENSVILVNEICNGIIDSFSEAVAVSDSIGNLFIKQILKDKKNYSVEQTSEIFRAYLTELSAKYGYSTAFIVDDDTLNYYTEWGYIKTLDISNADDNWYIPFKNSKKYYELNIDNDQANNDRLTIYVNLKIKDDDGKYLGTCGVGVPVESIVNFISDIEKRSNIDIKVLSSTGSIKLTNEGLAQNEKVIPQVYTMLQKYNNKNDFEYEPFDKDGYIILKYIPECNWFISITFKGGQITTFSTLISKDIIICLVILLALLITISTVISLYSKKITKYEQAALIDQLTGLKNRRAFEIAMKEISLLPSISDYSVIIMDVNGLKKTNDDFGHRVGDELLMGASKCLKEFYENHCEVYRIGGDEFLAFTNEPIDNQYDLITRFKSTLKSFKHDKITELGISIGIANAADNNITNIEDLIRLADRKMYEDKEAFYNDGIHERRRR